MPDQSNKPEKGVAGENTGAKARAAIKTAKARGATNKSIGRASNRDPDTIRQIESARIENPPADVAAKVSGAKSIAADIYVSGQSTADIYAAAGFPAMNPKDK